MAVPSLEPVTERILVDIETVLAAISTTHGSLSYWNDVQQVVRQNEEGGHDFIVFPTLVLVVHGNLTVDDLEEDFHSVNSESLLVEVEAHMRDIINVPLAHQRMIRDIRHAVMQAPRRDAVEGTNLAIHTFVGESSSEYPKAAQPISKATVALLVSYRTRVDALETPQ